jgi:hypothetical protein
MTTASMRGWPEKPWNNRLMPAFIDFPDYAGHSPAFNGALNRPRLIPLV